MRTTIETLLYMFSLLLVSAAFLLFNELFAIEYKGRKLPQNRLDNYKLTQANHLHTHRQGPGTNPQTSYGLWFLQPTYNLLQCFTELQSEMCQDKYN